MVEQVHPPKPSKPSSPPIDNSECSCLCCLSILGFIFLIVYGLYMLVVQPKALDYSIESIAIKGLNLTSPETIMSPEFNLTVRAHNPNRYIKYRYLKESSVAIFFKGVMLGTGVMPAFYQPAKNVTVFTTTLKGEGISLCCCDRTELVEAQNKLNVELLIEFKVAMEVKVRTFKASKSTSSGACSVTVDKLTPNPKLLSSDCSYGDLFT